MSKPFCVKFPIQDLNYILLLFFRMVVNKRHEFLLSFLFFFFPSITNEFLRKDIEPTPIYHQHQLHANSDHCRLCKERNKIRNFGLDQGIFGRIL